MFGGDNELGNILQEAVKIKSAQMGQKRKQYELWPYFVQHTLFHGEKEDFKAWRQADFATKQKESERIKEEGNALYQKGSYADAVEKYEEAPTMFHYCYSTDPGWRKNNRGIDDDVLVLVDDKGETDQEKEFVRKLRLTCCLNLAACKMKVVKYDEAIIACDVALQLDKDNVKALYRRAEARIRPAGATAYDHDCAIKDLAKAHDIEPHNQTVKTLLEKLRGERRVQREKDKQTFTGMFHRGQIYKKELEAGDENKKPDSSPNSEVVRSSGADDNIRDRIDNISEEDSLEKRCADAELLRDLYMRNGKEEEAKNLNEQIQTAKKALKERSSGRTGLDWENPTAEMVEDAKKYDLDLHDPVVIAELKRLEREGCPAENQDGEDEEERPPRSSSAASSSQEAPPPPSVDLPLPEVEHYVPIPWLRYVVLFAVMAVFWRLVHEGAVMATLRFVVRTVRGTWRRSQNPEDEGGGSLFAALYSQLSESISGTFGGSGGDEEEL
eukprot:gnl/TRDRNA2_/TRDRNA2_185157_c0_seq1.p1 gnl/TRDRNA2_/TRDRNA2_185157_c0~~gnl/TRDRNA2_/TRDRNA2_185157_c0_seq1.p1  ORF type:complete len:498 (+),score=132.91 gnl/TRDRNA2_/TRDRNA2_185157_c0_seq1:145-1638(+)